MKKSIMLLMLCSLICLTGCTNNGENGEDTGTQVSAETETDQEDGKPEYNALDYVTLGEYKGLAVTLIDVAVTEEEVEARIDENLEQKDVMEENTEGVVAENDTVNIDYVGTVDGEDIEGGTDKNIELVLDAETMTEVFAEGDFGVTIASAMAEGVKGAEIGSEVKVNVTFPETYESDEELAGKEAVFTVTINYVKTAPELTDDLVTEISEYKTVQEYKESVRAQLEEEKAQEQETQKVNDLFAAIYNNSTINEYPQEVVDYNMETLISYYEAYAEDAGQTMEEFLEQNFQTTEEQFREDSLEMVKESLAQEMILKAIAETENLTISESEYQESLEEYAESAGVTADEYLETTSKQDLLFDMLIDKALAVVEDSAELIEPGATETNVQEETTLETEK